MRSKSVGYLTGAGGAFLAAMLLLPFRGHLNTTPVALIFLLVVLFTAAGFGSKPALVASIVSVLFFNFFFIPPYHTLAISDPQNWIALAVFLITALIAGELSAREKRRAEEAELRKLEIERLYVELREAFDKASQAEAIKQSEQLKSALLDAVTHDLRTPLTSMKAAVTTLLPDTETGELPMELDEEVSRELLEVINAEIDRLNRLVEGLIEMAKIEAGAMEPRRSWSNPEEIISIALMRVAGVASDHRIRVTQDNDLSPVRVDEKALAEVLYVLIENAAKYSAKSTEILIAAKRTGDGALQMSVEDRGRGIPADLREKVFDKFFRVVGSEITPGVTGLGMGLAIARGIVQAHKGRIWIEDGSGGLGTRVSFVIPFQKQEITIA